MIFRWSEYPKSNLSLLAVSAPVLASLSNKPTADPLTPAFQQAISIGLGETAETQRAERGESRGDKESEIFLTPKRPSHRRLG